jgi:hypothetical protein
LFTTGRTSSLSHCCEHDSWEHHKGLIKVVAASGQRHQIEINSFSDVECVARQFPGARLPLVRHQPFRVGVRGLFGWARAEGYLHGQRNRIVEHAMIALRNHAAHRPWARG